MIYQNKYSINDIKEFENLFSKQININTERFICLCFHIELLISKVSLLCISWYQMTWKAKIFLEIIKFIFLHLNESF